ncbi:Atp-binding protein [Globisporangium polare]
MTITSRVKDELFETNEFRPIRIATSVAPPQNFDDDLPAIRSRGTPWSPEEHERFLEALAQFPYGPWRVIAEHVGTRTARQAMSHAQKYRQKITRRKRDVAKHKAAQRTDQQQTQQPKSAAALEQQRQPRQQQQKQQKAPAKATAAKTAANLVRATLSSRYELPTLQAPSAVVQAFVPSPQAFAVDASEQQFQLGAFYAGASSYYDYAQSPFVTSAVQLPLAPVAPLSIAAVSAVSSLADFDAHTQMLDWQAYLLALNSSNPASANASTATDSATGSEPYAGFIV